MAHLVVSLAALATIVVAYTRFLHVSNATTEALSFLLVVLVTAATSHLWVAVTTSFVAMGLFNYFFLPPVGTLTVADPQNWVALFTFLAVSLVASRLSATARARTAEANARREEVTRLFDLSRDVLLVAQAQGAMAQLAGIVARRFALEQVAICLPTEGTFDVFHGGASELDLSPGMLRSVWEGASRTLEFDALERTYAGHGTVTTHAGRVVRLVPLRLGNKLIGLLAASDTSVAPGALDALAGLVAIAIERVQFLEERKAADLARQGEELKSALLASLGHDLRTPLTAIRVAGSNLQSTWLTDDQRREQAAIVLSEAEHLTRLFHNILEMARLEAKAVASRQQWSHPSEIVDEACAAVTHALTGHEVMVDVTQPAAVLLDPQLTANALSHLLENAAQYSASGAAIEVSAEVTTEGLVLRVRDHGPGIAEADLPRLFDRFYRGVQARTRVAGTGMGLAIARGLLAVEGGRVWAENVPGGGARFTITVPAASRPLDAFEEVRS